MQLRRGILLAAIHLVVAVSLGLWLDAKDAHLLDARNAKMLSDLYSSAAGSAKAPNATKETPQSTVAPEEEVEFDLDPCSMNDSYSPESSVVLATDMPAAMITGWRNLCPAKWTVAGRLGVSGFWVPPELGQRQVDLTLYFLVAFQWLLVGSFPLFKPRSWWREPGALITLCTVPAALFVLIPRIEWMAQLFVTIAMFIWIFWFFALIWKVIRFSWRFAARQMEAAKK